MKQPGGTMLQQDGVAVVASLIGLMGIAMLPVLHDKGILAFLSVLSYVASLCMVKICLKEVFLSGFKYPYTVTCMPMFFTAICASMIDRPKADEGKSTFALSVVKAASLGLNNMALLFGTTAFVSIISACTPATT